MICRELEKSLGVELTEIIAPTVLRYYVGLKKWNEMVKVLSTNGCYTQVRDLLKVFNVPYCTSNLWRGFVYALSPYHRECRHCKNVCKEGSTPSLSCPFVVDMDKVAATEGLNVQDMEVLIKDLTSEESEYYNQPFLMKRYTQLAAQVLEENLPYIRSVVMGWGHKHRGIRFIAQYQNLDIDDLINDIAAHCWGLLLSQDWCDDRDFLTKVVRNGCNQNVHDIREHYSTQSRRRITNTYHEIEQTFSDIALGATILYIIPSQNRWQEGEVRNKIYAPDQLLELHNGLTIPFSYYHRTREADGYQSTVQSLDAISCGDKITPSERAPFEEVDNVNFLRKLYDQSSDVEKKFIQVIIGKGESYREISAHTTQIWGCSADEVTLENLVGVFCEYFKVERNTLKGLGNRIQGLVN